MKVTLQDETRRFDLPDSATFGIFKTLIVERFFIDREDFSVQYRDEDGDLVTVSSDAELHEAIDCMKVKGSVRFILAKSAGSFGMDDAFAADESPKRKKENEMSNSSDVESSKHSRKHGKKFSKKEEKLSKKEALKRELIEDLRKEFGSAMTVDSKKSVNSSTSPSVEPSIEPAAMDSSLPSPPPSPQIPSGEKLQALLQAVVENLGVPPHTVYNYLNDLTPEKVRETMSSHSVMYIFRMMMSSCGMQAGSSAPEHGGRPSFVLPPLPPFGGFPSRGCPPGHGPHGPPGHGPHGPPGHGPYGPPGHGPHGPPGHGPHGGHWPRGPPHWSPAAWSGCFPWPAQNGVVLVPSPVPVNATSVPAQRSLDHLPPLPAAPLQLGSFGDDVAALQSSLVVLGYLQCGPWQLAQKKYGKRVFEAILR